MAVMRQELTDDLGDATDRGKVKYDRGDCLNQD